MVCNRQHSSRTFQRQLSGVQAMCSAIVGDFYRAHLHACRSSFTVSKVTNKTTTSDCWPSAHFQEPKDFLKCSCKRVSYFFRKVGCKSYVSLKVWTRMFNHNDDESDHWYYALFEDPCLFLMCARVDACRIIYMTKISDCCFCAHFKGPRIYLKFVREHPCTTMYTLATPDCSCYAQFKDPNVSLKGVTQYARGVNKLFDQKTSSMQVLSCYIKDTTTITVEWRLEGRVNVGPGLEIKPYIVSTDLKLNEEGLVESQEDIFSIPGWEILVWALLPFMRPFLSPPAPRP